MADLVLVERDEAIAVVLLNRPRQLNALSDELMDELVSELQRLDRDEAIRCIVLGGSERAFAAGADIGELAQSSAIELYYARRVERWDGIRNLWTPLVAAVSGYCLGGGCELAMSCDLIIASVATRLAKEAVNRAYESTLQLGLEYERRALYLSFASEDAKEGLSAFTEKRKPDFRGR